MRDVDLRESVITVRNTKFFKERLIPIGPKLTRELLRYAEFRRHRQPLLAGEDSPFFANPSGTRWNRRVTQNYFSKVRGRAGVVRQGAGCQPRLHDYRHTAAQHRIEAWYRQGRDVEPLLQQLATFLGHKDLASLQHYLHMTPELLSEASRRFERYAQPRLS
jgi:integrase